MKKWVGIVAFGACVVGITLGISKLSVDAADIEKQSSLQAVFEQQIDVKSLYEVENDINLPLHLHKNNEATVDIVKQTYFRAEESSNGLFARTSYITASGEPITVAETQDGATLDIAKTWYDSEVLTEGTILGYPAIFEDGIRKTVHFVANGKFFTVSAIVDDLNTLIAIAEQFKVKPNPQQQ
ncbi:hypothetical protein [Aureibacillus halotolerans]|uniref:Uncharacterized protein n=1 Tax=Aureibacillus halotolerans TaxID=1508390 RepID=A0A4R6U8Q7_9BACI|nr:hypothetical protein [Aureibacillus halotolerans]TDQ41179.1 hypothetical protein EV213_104177 [Aureibacillus halotolerans]